MIYDFYFRFYKITHSERISVILSYAALFIYNIQFFLKCMVIKKERVEMSETKALEILQKTSPKPTQVPDYYMAPLNEKIDLSIIVPVYNHIDVLKRCIDSLINQTTHYNYEVILVDDGSTDGAEKLVDKYNVLEKVRVIHQVNGGIAAARNTGICCSQGKYLMFVDCDDYVHGDIVESLIGRAYKENADIVMCAHTLVKVKNGEIVSRLPNIYPTDSMAEYKKKDGIMNYPGLPWGKVYRRKLFEKVRFFPGYWYEDTIIQSLVFTQCKKFVYIPEVKYEYQWHESNFSHTQGGKNQSKAVDRYWLLKEILERYDEIGLKKDTRFYTMLLTHISVYYYPTISSLPQEVVQAMFLSARELLLKYRPSNEVKLPYMLRFTEKAVIDEDIALWKLCSLNQ